MEKIYEEVEEFLKTIEKAMEYMDLDAQDVFLNGDCGNLYKMFAKRFGKLAKPFVISYKGKPYHMLTGIGEKIYDIRGETGLEDYVEYFIESEKDPTLRKEDFDIKQISDEDKIIRTEELCDNYIMIGDWGDECKIDHLIATLLREIKERPGNANMPGNVDIPGNVDMPEKGDTER